MKRAKIGIVDYGVGNLGSLASILRNLGFGISIIHTPNDLDTVSIVILPGVGSFGPCIDSLTKSKLKPSIKKWAKAGNKVVGICIGMQLLATSSEENGLNKGLNLIPGTVRRIGRQTTHIGWNKLCFTQNIQSFENFQNKLFYFNHGYVLNTDTQFQVATSEFIENIVAIIRKNNIWGIQFHPENSQQNGLALLSKILKGP